MLYKNYEFVIRKNVPKFFSTKPWQAEIQDFQPKSNNSLWGKVVYADSPEEVTELAKRKIEERIYSQI